MAEPLRTESNPFLLSTRRNEVRWTSARKIRQLISELEKAGFVNRGGKGSHRNFVHGESGASLTLSGQTDADAGNYQEKDVKEAIRKAKGQ
jgi:predicted RNA binding protein YcfA (HicA-like mRNA interferase family)